MWGSVLIKNTSTHGEPRWEPNLPPIAGQPLSSLSTNQLVHFNEFCRERCAHLNIYAKVTKFMSFSSLPLLFNYLKPLQEERISTVVTDVWLLCSKTFSSYLSIAFAKSCTLMVFDVKRGLSCSSQ